MCCLLIRFHTFCALFCTYHLFVFSPTEQAKKGILIILNASLWRYVPRWRFFKNLFSLRIVITFDCLLATKMLNMQSDSVMCCLLIRYYTYCILNFFVPFVVSSALRNKLKKVSWQSSFFFSHDVLSFTYSLSKFVLELVKPIYYYYFYMAMPCNPVCLWWKLRTVIKAFESS